MIRIIAVSLYVIALMATSASAQVSFESNWDTGCTGNDSSCMLDDGTWTGTMCSFPEIIAVDRGGEGDTPVAPTGDYVLRINSNGTGCGGVTHPRVLDLTRSNHYMRYYEYVDCGWDKGGGLQIHGFQNIPPSSNFYFRHAGARNFPGPDASVSVGYTSLASSSASDCNGNGNSTMLAINDGSPRDFQKQCGRWYRHELWIECPDGDACMNTGGAVGVRVHYRYHEVATPGSGAGTLVADDDDIYAQHYNGVTDRTPVSLTQLYTPVSQGGLDACVSILGGDPSFSIGQSGQVSTQPGFDTWGFVDGYAYSGSNTREQWIGPHCEAEPGAPECDGSAPPASPDPDPTPDPDPLSAPDFLAD